MKISNAIVVESVSKEYILGRRRSSRLVDVLSNIFKNPFSTNKNIGKFLALDDISFELREGDKLGVIGRNGAGKSTLLKVISKITRPTTGMVKRYGMVSSLLEVGTGFHPELTGRENVFLNGSILGISRSNIKRRFDEIVEFSGTEKFIDTAIKHYSSGMQVRLAFSVAAHLDSEILLVDEVLAVGDRDFQKKCLEKMDDISGRGKSIIFVSHSMQAIKRLCNQVIVLNEGKIVFNGSMSEGVAFYLKEKYKSKYISKLDPNDHPYVKTAYLIDADENTRDSFSSNEIVTLLLEFRNPRNQHYEVQISFWDDYDNKLWMFNQIESGMAPMGPEASTTVKLSFHPPALNTAEVRIHLGVNIAGEGHYSLVDHQIDALAYSVVPDANRGLIVDDSIFVCKGEKVHDV